MSQGQENRRWDIEQPRRDVTALKSRARGSISISSLSSALHTAKQVLIFLTPTPIQGLLYPSAGPTSGIAIRPKPTAWLDGMRGIAALLVFFYHLSYSTHDVYTGWSKGHHDFLRLPFIKTLYNGPAMVSLFFVLSGYALSYKPVKQMRNGEHDALFSGLSSSVFRRVIRLYLPCVASTLMIVVLVRLGFYSRTMELANDANRLPGTREHHAWRYDTISEQVWIWMRSFWGFMNPFSTTGLGKGIYMDGHLWTIPVEYKASIILYVTHLGLSRLRPALRMLSLVCLLVWTHRVDYWTMSLFYGGFLMAELDIRRSALKACHKTESNNTSRILWSALYITVFLCGVFLAGQPERNVKDTAVWATIIPLTPNFIIDKWRYWTSWGALLIVWSTSNDHLLQQIFTNSVSQYLGRISFSLYLVHGSIIHTLGYGLLQTLWSIIGEDRKETCFVLMATCVTVVAIWWSDVFTRLVDVPSVNFARWFEGKCAARQKTELKEEPAWRDASALV
ncbi:hypothetical protein E4T50_13345 [Aureobasidium sp. EXF-12298]|nr:hypothetical protein E4T50_13345 [Aureobasidium sp. EXF-12298]KAI4765696.1 hypothetical protein E4T51_01335 [Aureobasidium sp. EXF-12344]KAI4773735.1 hypothetical protein E4T52_11279 [Aureobasidium sp. EXF-3400]